MEQCKITWWDYFWWPKFIIQMMGWDKDDKVFGISAVQFIKTSNVTIHALYNLKKVYVNIFSCKDFDEQLALSFTKNFFEGVVANQYTLERW